MSTTGVGDARHAMRCMEIWGGSHATETLVSTPGLDAWIYSMPHEGADQGGDVHYVSLCGGGVITRLIVADVSGHGGAVAEVARSLRTILRRNINSKSQARLVQALNRQFAALAQMRRFATAVVATYLNSRRRLTVCNAGHPRPLWFRVASGEWTLLEQGTDPAAPGLANLPLGLLDETSYDQVEVTLDKGDVLVFYTDALIEAGNEAGQLLGERGLLEIARGLDPSDLGSMGPALLDEVARHRGGSAADDDVTLLVLHHNAGRPPRQSIGEKLDVYARFFGLKPV
jgi:phosphoserine phosphatase RsbU/P